MSSSSSMPPPPSPLAHRRSRAGPNLHLPPSPPYSPDTSPCTHHKMSLAKSATFHVPLSPPTEDSPVLSIRHLARRSPTGSQSSLFGLLFEKEDDVARSIQDFEQTFSGARGGQRAHRRGKDEYSARREAYIAPGVPLDEGLGSSLGSPTEKDLPGAFERALDLDSGLGSSTRSESPKRAHVQLAGDAPEEDGLSVEDLIQGVVNKAPKTRQRSLAVGTSSAIVRSISPMVLSRLQQPNLGAFARKKLAENILQPILREDRFKFFHPLASSLGSRTNKTIKCLRDLEQSLLFEPLVSTILQMLGKTNTYPSPLNSKKLALSHQQYRSFAEFSIQLVLETFHHLSESEQRRASDRPYNNGYFLDLVQQVGRLAAQVGAARRAHTQQNREAGEGEMDYSAEDEITLEGGLGQTGRPAELVRWKNGKGTSLRTSEPYEAQPVIKRQRSNESLDDHPERSMARRKKNAEPRVTELRCYDPTCDKVFNRKCDLAKHEKTHSRPFKCPERTCKYHEQGLPTEKERERHVNDKHSTNPRYFHCKYCTFKTKRDSNCKQHMEKKHGWQYDRVKGNSKSMSTPQQTPQTPSLSTPGASDEWAGGSLGSPSEGETNYTPYSLPMDDFGDTTQAPSDPYHRTLFPTGPLHSTRGNTYASPDVDFNASPYSPAYMADVAGNMIFPPSRNGAEYLNTPSTPIHPNGQAFNVAPLNPLHIDINYHDGMPLFPSSDNHLLRPQSRNPSISGVSPMVTDDHLFPSPQHTTRSADEPMSNNYIDMANLPNDDFALFGAAGDPSMVSSTGNILPYDAMDLLGSMEGEFSDSQMGRYVNF